MELFDCPTCGRGEWTTYEIENGTCPCCREEDWEDEYDEEENQSDVLCGIS